MPLFVLAKSVNCETQRTSPSMSCTFFFHIAPDVSSENTLSDTLRYASEDQTDIRCAAVPKNATTHICFVRFSRSDTVSSILCMGKVELDCLAFTYAGGMTSSYTD